MKKLRVNTLTIFGLAIAGLIIVLLLGKAVSTVSASRLLAPDVSHDSQRAESTATPMMTLTLTTRTPEPQHALDDHGHDLLTQTPEAHETEIHHSVDDGSVVDDHGHDLLHETPETEIHHSADHGRVIDDHSGSQNHTSQDDGGSHHSGGGGHDGGGHK